MKIYVDMIPEYCNDCVFHNSCQECGSEIIKHTCRLTGKEQQKEEYVFVKDYECPLTTIETK